MAKYIYFHDTDTISLCENDEDTFNKIANLRARTPERRWTLVEALDDDRFRVIIRSHNDLSALRRVVVVAMGVILFAILFLILAYATGVL